MEKFSFSGLSPSAFSVAYIDSQLLNRTECPNPYIRIYMQAASNNARATGTLITALRSNWLNYGAEGKIQS